ncbi:MAG: outer membrane beta-barrel protein, partial [Tannerella sp.]|nr:outer membrane beta-barrel protein [Tannerella sp.]
IAGYAVDNQTVLLGVDYRYNIKDRIRLAPSVLYALKSGENKMDTWYVNADAHYLARLTERFTMYPIGGLGLSMWAWDVPAFGTENPENPEETEETEEIPTPTVKTSRETKMRVGLNIGIGCENRVTDEIVIGVEFKYNLTTERIYNQAMLSARVAYYF